MCTHRREGGRPEGLSKLHRTARRVWNDDRVFVLALGAAAALLQTAVLVWFWQRNPAFVEDFEDGDIARNLLAGRGYVAGEGWLTPAYEPTAHKTPVYVLVLAAIYGVFDGSQVPVTILNAGLLVCVYVGTYLCFRSWVEPASAKAGALFLLASPLLLKRATSGLNVPLAALLVLAFLASIAFTHSGKNRYRRAAIAGLAGGTLLLTLPSAALLVAAGYYRLWRPRSGFPWDVEPSTVRRNAALVAAVTCALVLAPWTLRNAIVFGDFVPLSSQLPLELAIGNGPTATGGLFRPDGTPVLEPSPQTVEEARARGLDEVAAYRFYGARALSWSLHNPRRWLELRVLSATYFFFPQNLFYSVYRSLPGYPRTLVYTVALIGLSGVGWLISKRRYPLSRLASSAIFWTAIVYAATHANVDSKYREPVDPLLAGFAGVALVHGFRWLGRLYRQRSTPQLLGSAGPDSTGYPTAERSTRRS